jgi:hypothetical protein
MASTPAERELRTAVAQLAVLSDDEVRGVLSHLDDGEVKTITGLLAQAGATLEMSPTSVAGSTPAWALQRLGLPSPDVALRPARAPRVTRHALAILQHLVLELPPSPVAEVPSRSRGNAWRRLWRTGMAWMP